MNTPFRILAYYGTLACFGLYAAGFNLRCALRRGAGDWRAQRAVQYSIHRLFRNLIRWLAFVRLIEIEYRGFERLPSQGCVIVANHPGLLDAIFLLARVPAAVCVFKPSVRRNPLLGPAAVRAGYLPSDRRLELVRAAAASIRTGTTLLVFPEGTRTPAGRSVGPFKPGFALIARRAATPVQLVRITVEGSLLAKGQALWQLPRLPARVVLEAGPCFDSTAIRSTAALVAATEAWFRVSPAGAAGPAVEALPAPSASFTLSAS